MLHYLFVDGKKNHSDGNDRPPDLATTATTTKFTTSTTSTNLVDVDRQDMQLNLDPWNAITDWIIICVLVLFLILITLVAHFTIKHHRSNRPIVDETSMQSWNVRGGGGPDGAPSNPTRNENGASKKKHQRNLRHTHDYEAPLIEEDEDDDYEEEFFGEVVINGDLKL